MWGVCLLLASLALENDALKVLFREGDSFGVTGVVNKVAGNVSFAASTSDVDFWRVRFAVPGAFTPMGGKFKDQWGGHFREFDVSSRSNCRSRHVERIADGLVFVWEGVDLEPPDGRPPERGVLDVRATVVVPKGDAPSRWTIDVENRSRTYGLVRTHYPVFRRLGPPGACDGLLPRFNLGAGLVRNCGSTDPAGRDVEVAGGPYPAYRPMMAAFLQGDAGVLAMADDAEGRLKNISVDGQNTVWFDTILEDAGRPGKTARSPKYAVTLEAFRGDWWEAARRYRKRALTRPWTSKGRILDRKDYPRRLCETDFWINLHGDASVASNVLFTAREEFPDLTCGLHWHAWSTHGFETHYPEFFPGKPGVKDAIAAVQRIGQVPLMYVNGRFRDTELPSWRQDQVAALKLPSGVDYVERYWPNWRRQVLTCPYVSRWQDVMTQVADRLSGEYAAQGVFFDQYGAARPNPCFNPEHGHPLGGGAWWTEGCRKIFARAHELTSSRGTFLVTEGTAETWMDDCDGYLCVTLLAGDDVPFYPAVYSGRTTYFGSPVSEKDSLDAFWAIQARQVIWGVAPGWYEKRFVLDRTDPVLREKRRLLGELCRFRKRHLDALAYGELVDEARFDSPPDEIEVTLNGRWAFSDTPPKTYRMPAVVGSVWRDGKTGRRVTFLANLTAQSRAVSVYGRHLTLKPRELRTVDRERIFCIVAHPDDMIACAGTMLLLKDRFEIHELVLTHGERGLGQQAFWDGSAKARRTAEEESAAAMLDARLYWGDEIDGEVFAGRDTCRKVADLLKKIRPRAVFSMSSQERHPDHAMSAAVAQKAIHLAGMRDKLEVYFMEEAYDSRSFVPAHYVDITEVLDLKREYIRKSVCQNPEDQMCRDEVLDSLMRGQRLANWVHHPYGKVPEINGEVRLAAAERFAARDGLPQGSRCLFNEMKLPKGGWNHDWSIRAKDW